MFNKYYQQELAQLRDLGAEFSKAHPTLAPMLAGQSSDPDVERVLEGTAFLTGMLRGKLDDEFPEVVHDLLDLVAPHYLRPVPATAMVAFTPRPSLKQSAAIPAGAVLSSIPVEGTACPFRTTSPVDLHPLTLVDASLAQPAGRPPAIRIAFELTGQKLSAWQPGKLRLHLAEDYAAASDLWLLLCRHVARVTLSAEGGKPCVLGKDAVSPGGFGDDEGMIPYPPHAWPGFRLLQEYFVAPERFLFVDLSGFDRWTERGEGTRFEVSFELDELPFAAPRVRRESFMLFVAPAINLFPFPADPILLDHRQSEYMVRPSGTPEHYQVYSIDQVSGFVQGTAEERRYVPFELFNPDPDSAPAWHVSRRNSPVRPGFDAWLSVAYPPKGAPPQPETLSLRLTCTNGSLAEKLRAGDISRPTAESPEFADFRNLRPPTPCVHPPLGGGTLWRLVSHMSLNHLTWARAENLQALLGTYLFPEGRDRSSTLANRKRIAGIERVEASAVDRLVSGIMMRGQEVRVSLRQDNFAGPGDLYLFGSVLDRFLACASALNSFTVLVVRESAKGESHRWPARLGNHPLI
jgi:type VI secretion system protein ImpG